jgi:zeaxanthin glucosyltransferase
MKIAFLSPPVQGHLNPMTALARELQLRNHDVVFLSLLDAESFVRAAGLTFVPYCEKEFPAGFLNERLRQLAKWEHW